MTEHLTSPHIFHGTALVGRKVHRIPAQMVIGKNPKRQADLFQVTIATNHIKVPALKSARISWSEACSMVFLLPAGIRSFNSLWVAMRRVRVYASRLDASKVGNTADVRDRRIGNNGDAKFGKVPVRIHQLLPFL